MADYGRYGDYDRDRDYGRDRDRDRFGANREGGNRFGSDRDDRTRGGYQGRDAQRDYRDDDRGYFARGADEVRSWFGDEEAERRRQADERRDPESTYHYRGNPPGGGFGNQTGGQFGRPQSFDYGDSYDRAASRPGPAGFGAYQQPSHHEPEYRSWREQQLSSYDRDYDEYRKHRQTRFNSEFEDWRSSRNTQAGAQATGSQWSTKVKEHQEVLGSDGEHVGTIDHVDGDNIKLAKTDPGSGGHHRLIPLSSIASVDSAVRLNQTAAEAKKDWKRPTA